MATNVYPLPAGLVQSLTLTPQHRNVIETEFFGAPSTVTAVTSRVDARLEGLVHKNNHAAFLSWIDRMAGGAALTAFADIPMRVRQGWDATAAINSSGVEYWRESGATSGFPGGTPSSPWRTAACQAAGAASADATSIAVDGLLSTETIKAGTPIRIGTWRYTVRAAVTASAGAATLQLAHPLRASVSDNATVTIPGDLSVYRLIGPVEMGATGQVGEQSFSALFREVYSSEFTGGFTWVTT